MAESTVTRKTRGEDERRLVALKKQYSHELLGTDERGMLLDKIVKLEKKLGRR